MWLTTRLQMQWKSYPPSSRRILNYRPATLNKHPEVISIQTEILYGIHPVAEALAAGRRRIHEIYLSQGKGSQRIDDIIKKSQALKTPIKHLPLQQIHSLTGKEAHQGIAARVNPYPVLSFSDLAEEVNSYTKSPFYLLIDHVVDPHNLGALLRTALCAGVDGVIIPKDRSAGPSPVVSKTSAGALEHIRLAQVANMVYAISDLKKTGVWIIGLDKNGTGSLYEMDMTGSIAIVIGGEENGIRPLVKKNCDFLTFIPQFGPVSSLNASVAGGVAMYEAYRQRNKSRLRNV
jgi:23S rRNA (guanosine2251-2'-O)-methyltransferase